MDESVLVKNEVELIIQVNGKLRSRITVDIDTPQETIEAMVVADKNVLRHVEEKLIKKMIYIKGKLVNVVV
jgi:leucyl-tRNA synthetase